MNSTGVGPRTDLTGIGALVTRPAGQAAALCDLIRAVGGRPIWFPALKIVPQSGDELLRERLTRLSPDDILIFISPNAVIHGLPMIGAAGGLPEGIRVAAVGRGTERALRRAGMEVAIRPVERFDSEGLLATEALQQMEGRRVIIVRGVGGRALLGDSLRERGARVEYAEVYRRVLPKADAGPLIARWGEDVDVVIATSNAILDNLFTLLGEEGAGLLRSTPLIVVSKRGAAHARKWGVEHVVQAQGADDDALLHALGQWAATR